MRGNDAHAFHKCFTRLDSAWRGKGGIAWYPDRSTSMYTAKAAPIRLVDRSNAPSAERHAQSDACRQNRILCLSKCWPEYVQNRWHIAHFVNTKAVIGSVHVATEWRVQNVRVACSIASRASFIGRSSRLARARPSRLISSGARLGSFASAAISFRSMRSACNPGQRESTLFGSGHHGANTRTTSTSPNQ